jgi:adenylate kinase family enzyme
MHLSTGDIIRRYISEEAEEPGKDPEWTAKIEMCRALVKDGAFVPDELVADMLLRARKEGNAHYALLDGFPRTKGQAEIVDRWFRLRGVLYFHAPREVMIDRVLRRGRTSGRDDDNEVTVERRLERFYRETLPLVESYRERDLLVEVNTDREVEEVRADVEGIVSGIWPEENGAALTEPECSMSSGWSCENLKSLRERMGAWRGQRVDDHGG